MPDSRDSTLAGMNPSAPILFFKAEPFGLFGVPTPVKGYVNQRAGKLIAPYTGIRHQKLQKPDHPISDHLFAHAPDVVASSHVQPAPANHDSNGNRKGGGDGGKGGGEPPPENGPFGPIFRQFHHDAPGAITHLKQQKTGEAVAALYHPEVGDIDLVWGETSDNPRNKGRGLAKLEKWHPEILNDLQGALLKMKVHQRHKDVIHLRSGSLRGAIKLTFDNQQKTWLLTAYDADQTKSGAGNTPDRIPALSGSETVETNPAPSTSAPSTFTLPPPAPKGKLHKGLPPLVRILLFKAA